MRSFSILLGLLCVSGFAIGFIAEKHDKQKHSIINPNPDYGCETHAYPPQEHFALPWFKIDLDTSPRNRWDEITEAYKEPLNELVDQLIHLVSYIDPSGKILKFVDEVLPLLILKFPKDYRQEIEGISSKSGIPLGRMVVFNIFYELFSVCTSIVAENGETGQHYHARNLDFGLFLGWDTETHTWKVSEILRKMEFNVEFQKGGKGIFNQSSFAGYVGTLNGVKAGLYSISLNERFAVQGGLVGLFDWLVGQEDLYFATWLARDLLTGDYSYDEVIDKLSTTPLIAPCYYIVSGVEHNQGHLITRAINESLYPLQLDAENGRWYLLETNYDHWKKPFILDDRRTPAEACMNESSYQTIDQSHLFNVLSTNPVLNQLTVYTVLMNPQTGEMKSYRQFCPSCFIW